MDIPTIECRVETKILQVGCIETAFDWITRQYGWIVWYVHDTQTPEGYGRILSECRLAEMSTADGANVVAFVVEGAEESFKFSVRIKTEYFLLWKSVLDCNALNFRGKMSTNFMSSLFLDKPEHSSGAILELHIADDCHKIVVHPNENIEQLRESIMRKFHLKPDLATKVEVQLMRAKLDACTNLQVKLSATITRLQRHIMRTALAEERAVLAEEHCDKMSTSMVNISCALVKLEEAFELSLKAFEEEIAELYFRLDSERSKVNQISHQLFAANARILDLETTLESLSGQFLKPQGEAKPLSIQNTALMNRFVNSQTKKNTYLRPKKNTYLKLSSSIFSTENITCNSLTDTGDDVQLSGIATDIFVLVSEYKDQLSESAGKSTQFLPLSEQGREQRRIKFSGGGGDIRSSQCGGMGRRGQLAVLQRRARRTTDCKPLQSADGEKHPGSPS